MRKEKWRQWLSVDRWLLILNFSRLKFFSEKHFNSFSSLEFKFAYRRHRNFSKELCSCLAWLLMEIPESRHIGQCMRYWKVLRMDYAHGCFSAFWAGQNEAFSKSWFQPHGVFTPLTQLKGLSGVCWNSSTKNKGAVCSSVGCTLSTTAPG